MPRLRHDARAEERVRISEAMREVQRDLARAESLMRIERATNVADKYGELVRETRRVAGGYIRDAWNRDPIEDDSQMNVPGGLDFSQLDSYHDAYLGEVATDLAWYRFWR